MKDMTLTEALDILKENNAEVLTETTAFSAPTYCLGMLVSYAIDKYLKDLKAQLEEEDDPEYKAKIQTFYDKINDAYETVSDRFEEDLGEKVFEVLEVNPYEE